ncbi:thioesterase family protein [Paraburkholderia sp. IW21]|uniref:thioesterase family protein n=1 Tax=Paraburkholderia sp. IW21 TaxID=3242488 RepID=UPI003520440B
MTTLEAGLRHSATLAVTNGLTVPEVSPSFPAFADMPRVFATAYLVGFIEATCIEALHPYLAGGEGTVGTHIDVSHCAATPVGMTVLAEVELIGVEGRKLRFRVQCRDERDVIAEGFHERVIIDRDRFMTRILDKAVPHRNG